MPSSISSSRFENEYQTLDSTESQRIALRTVLAAVLVFGLVVGIFYGLTSLANLNGRVQGQLDYLPTFAATNSDRKRVMILGSSMVQAGFEPAVFDEYMNDRGIDTISYNYGVGNLDPEFQELITRHIRREFQSADTKLSLALVEFNPFQTTKIRGNFGSVTRDLNQSILMSPAELWQVAMDDPNRGTRLLLIRYLRNGLSAELITTAFTIAGAGDNSSIENYQEAGRRRSELSQAFQETLESGVSIFGSVVWNVQSRGGRANKSGLSVESLEAMGAWYASYRHPALMEADLRRRVRGGDILELDFDEKLVKAFINMVNNVSAVSEETEVILLPRNTDWVNYTVDVQARLNTLLQRIESETGVAVRNLQEHPDITPEHFVDTTHLSAFDGIDAFTQVLAEEYETTLQ